MAATGLLALIDDIATILDDVSVMTKVAAKKTAGVLGDDLALNAQQVTGINADRELTVVWAVARGSFKNKAFLVPGALIISTLLPWLITPLLMFGGLFLCYEGFEKLAHKFLHKASEDEEHHQDLVKALSDPSVDLVAMEREKIQGAVRTDLILSAEIIVITLGLVSGEPLGMRVAVLVLIALLMTVGVYGLVAGIVKLDDAGLYLYRGGNGSGGMRKVSGKAILKIAPFLMKFLSIAGTAAMFMVGGGILAHGIPGAYDLIHDIAHSAHDLPLIGGVAESVGPLLLEALLGIASGGLAVGLLKASTSLFKKQETPA